VTPLHPVLWTAHILLGVGLAAPCMTIVPRLGSHTALGEWLGLLDEPRTYSILSGIADLLAGRGVWIGLLLLVFSVLFPVAKLVALRMAVADRHAGRPLNRLHGALAGLGRYSMADVFVVALLVVASKTYPGGTEVVVRWGLYPFAASALLTMFASARVHSSTRRASSLVAR
jgi:paraquat-inducible protein A